MTAYVIVDIEVTDPEGYKGYVKLALEDVKFIRRKIASASIMPSIHPREYGSRRENVDYPPSSKLKIKV